MRKQAILVTGGAGYIGSHVVRQLGEAGESIVVLDDLSKGFRQSVLYGDLIVGDIGDPTALDAVFERYQIESVMHFAAHTMVPESIVAPLKYYRNNACGSGMLLDWAVKAGVRHFVFSSTAAVYGKPDNGIASEDNSPTAPVNPYGQSKLMTEWMLRDVAAVNPMRYVTLRYFNVAGSDPEARIGQSTANASLLIKVACEAAVGRREQVSIFGTDYPTPDGTGLRDYIHVEDIADAHLKALAYLRAGGMSTTLNCGYGHGYSVREVISTVETVAGRSLDQVESARRPDEPPALIAETSKIRSILGWKPGYDDLETIVADSLRWERKLAAGGGTCAQSEE
ncbi:UDP-glucose 4-epimerase GalE [Candidatus Rariloculus sp.]|uniref:UDP-glucose 4-epimerase GalE n=1 Tax=Candidatus Rariloculus sp. TaxID=3101265 RepID=UPI003D140192